MIKQISKIHLDSFNIGMKISFGAKLLTQPSSFYLKTDTPQQRQNIDKVFSELGAYLSCDKVDKLTAGDTVEIIREPRKNKFWYTINYNSAKIKRTLPIKIHVGKTADNFHFFDGFHQMTHVIGALNGVQRGLGENFLQFSKRVYSQSLPNKID